MEVRSQELAFLARVKVIKLSILGREAVEGGGEPVLGASPLLFIYCASPLLALCWLPSPHTPCPGTPVSCSNHHWSSLQLPENPLLWIKTVSTAQASSQGEDGHRICVAAPVPLTQSPARSGYGFSLILYISLHKLHFFLMCPIFMKGVSNESKLWL